MFSSNCISIKEGRNPSTQVGLSTGSEKQLRENVAGRESKNEQYRACE